MPWGKKSRDCLQPGTVPAYRKPDPVRRKPVYLPAWQANDDQVLKGRTGYPVQAYMKQVKTTGGDISCFYASRYACERFVDYDDMS
jgi:hypothetical protein